MTRDRPLSSMFTMVAILLGSCSARVEESRAEPPVDDGWAFSYSNRDRDSRSLIDLRSLNEPVAGQSGFVRLSPDGNSFVLGDGSPARFWAAGSEVFRDSAESIRRHVQFLAGMGVNLVRLHAQICSKGPNSKLTDVNEKEIDGIWRFVAEAKKQGIYVTISPYWANSTDSARWGIEGHNSPGALWGLLFFDEALQKGYKAWATALYARPNPYTSIPLAKDPSVAIIQVQNEDSLLFWTSMGAMKPVQKARFAQKYAEWLAKKYGSLDASKKAWGGASLKGDDLAAGKVDMVDLYQMTLAHPGGMGRRVADQTEFYATTQRDFYAGMVNFYRSELGCGQLINASNWKTASQTLLDDSERWSYTATDVIAVNRYYTGSHKGPSTGWRIEPGDKFSQKSALLNPRELPVNLKQVVGHPMIVTESTWVSPLAFQSEGPFLIAVYQSLTGVDAYYWFTLDAVDYKTQPHFAFQQVKGQQPLFKWSASIPPILGGFPADALLFRKGYVKQGEPVVHEERTLASLWNRETPLIAEDPSFDPNRDQGNKPRAPRPGEKSTAVDPLAFLVGPVEVKYDGDPSKTRVVDLSRYIDHDKEIVRSITGEVTLDYSVGLCTVNAPKAQGACGFLKSAGLIKLEDFSVRSANAYATVIAVSLDDLPLATSRRILVQIGTAARPTGWATRDVEFKGDGDKMTRGLEVVNTGKPPWRVADSEFGLSLRNPAITKATRLDPAGFPAEDVPLTKAKSGVTFTPPTDTMYLILE